MASDVLGPNSAFSEKINYADHLLENHILDDVEPQYENSEIIRKLLQKNNSFSKSLMAIHEEVLNTKGKEENIYENVGFIEESLNLINEKENLKPIIKFKEEDTKINNEQVLSVFNAEVNGEKLENENIYTSTFSLTIGTPPMVEKTEAKTPQNKELYIDVNSSEDAGGDDSDDGSFKSSYAKSLIDSFKKTNSSPQTSPVEDSSSSSRLSSPSVTHEDIKPFLSFIQPLEKEFAIQNSSKLYLPKNGNGITTKSVEQLEKRITSLTDNILMKDKELENLRQEIVGLRMECHRVKAENRTLKVGLPNGTHNQQQLRSASVLTNGGQESQPNSLSSISFDSDTWTLQQQVSTLNSQLEKAELSRHAYEAATKQLVHFLTTINTTLTTVAGPDTKMESPFTPQNTSELLSNLEMSLLQNRLKTNLSTPKYKPNPYFDSTKDGSFITIPRNEVVSPSQSLHTERKHHHMYHKHASTTRSHQHSSKESKQCGGGLESLSSASSQDSGHGNRFGDSKDLCNRDQCNKDHSNKEHGTKYHCNKDHCNKDHCTKDHSNKDHKNKDHSNKDHSNKDHSNKDHSNKDPSNKDPSNRDHSNRDHSNRDPSNNENQTKGKRQSPQRRFSISQKIWHSTSSSSKKSFLKRSGSVSNIPTEGPSIPRVSRAVSTHCVAMGKVDPGDQPVDEEEVYDEVIEPVGGAPGCGVSTTSSNRLLATKAKDFFSSLKNIFKTDGDRTPSTHPDPFASPTDAPIQTSKKRLTLPSIHRNKVKVDLSAPPLSLPPSTTQSIQATPSTSQVTLKKRHSLKSPLKSSNSVSRDSFSTGLEESGRNSVFYVPFLTTNSENCEDVATNFGVGGLKTTNFGCKDIATNSEICEVVQTNIDDVIDRRSTNFENCEHVSTNTEDGLKASTNFDVIVSTPPPSLASFTDDNIPPPPLYSSTSPPTSIEEQHIEESIEELSGPQELSVALNLVDEHTENAEDTDRELSPKLETGRQGKDASGARSIRPKGGGLSTLGGDCQTAESSTCWVFYNGDGVNNDVQRFGSKFEGSDGVKMEGNGVYNELGSFNSRFEGSDDDKLMGNGINNELESFNSRSKKSDDVKMVGNAIDKDVQSFDSRFKMSDGGKMTENGVNNDLQSFNSRFKMLDDVKMIGNGINNNVQNFKGIFAMSDVKLMRNGIHNDVQTYNSDFKVSGVGKNGITNNDVQTVNADNFDGGIIQNGIINNVQNFNTEFRKSVAIKEVRTGIDTNEHIYTTSNSRTSTVNQIGNGIDNLHNSTTKRFKTDNGMTSGINTELHIFNTDIPQKENDIKENDIKENDINDIKENDINEMNTRYINTSNFKRTRGVRRTGSSGNAHADGTRRIARSATDRGREGETNGIVRSATDRGTRHIVRSVTDREEGSRDTLRCATDREREGGTRDTVRSETDRGREVGTSHIVWSATDRGREVGTSGIVRRRSDFDVIGLKRALWKLSRESFRSEHCRLAFV